MSGGLLGNGSFRGMVVEIMAAGGCSTPKPLMINTLEKSWVCHWHNEFEY
jgi:hypothetical protein